MEQFDGKDRYDKLQEKLASALEAVQSIIEEKLDNYGIYYRIFSRVKSGQSIREKLASERYQDNPDKKLQDVLGLRVVLYYEDDIEVCKRIFANILEHDTDPESDMPNGFWKEYESKQDTFSATKINGVFELPGFIKRIVEPDICGLRVEPTFEIQLRTMFFEGWHEVEHDLRYKNMELWKDFPKESRKLNSILATLEMCDQYMVTLFDDIGHVFYKDENWGEMLRYKYRLKTLNGELDSEIAKYITVDLAKKIFKWRKEEFIDLALERNFSRLDANIIVYLVNESLKGKETYCPQIAERFDIIYQEMKQKTWISHAKDISKLRQEKAFEASVVLNTDDRELSEVMEELAACVYYEWLVPKLNGIRKEEFEKPLHPFALMFDGIIVSFSYDIEKLTLSAVLSYVDMDESAKIWNVSVEITEENGKLHVTCKKTRFIPQMAARTVMPFSKPGIYSDLAKKYGFIDVKRLKTKVLLLKEGDIEEFISFVENPERRFPVILISYANEEERFKKNSCYGRLVDYASNPKVSEQTHLMRKISYLSHVYCVSGEQAEQIAKILGEDASLYENGIRFFGKGFTLQEKYNYQSFDENSIVNHPKDTYALHSKAPYCYMSVSGADATRHEVIQMVYTDILR